MKTFLISSVFLFQVGSEFTGLPNWVDGLTTKGVLAVAVWWFMKRDQKNKDALEAIRKENERQLYEMTKTQNALINDVLKKVTEAMNNQAQKLDDLIGTLTKTK